MRAVLFLAAGLIGLPLAVFAQPAQQPDIPVVHYKAVPEWPKAPVGDKGFPSAWNYWQVTSIAVEKNGVEHALRADLLRVAPGGGTKNGTVVNEGLARWTYEGVTGTGIAEYLHQFDSEGRTRVPIE